MDGSAEHRALLDRLAVPRLAGSAAVHEICDLLADRLEALGFRVERQRFRTSPRRLAAASVGAAGAGWTALLVGPLLVVAVPGWPVTVVGFAGLALAGVLAAGVARGHLPWGGASVEALNLVATRGAPAVWLVAHSDSKAQRFSLAARVLAVGALLAGGAGFALLLLVRPAGPLPWWAVAPWFLLMLWGGGLLSLGMPRDASPGAVDNASGLVAVLTAAERLRDREDVGVLITGAEEFGMEGARRWVEGGPSGMYFVNFDGLDADGAFRVMGHAPSVGVGPARAELVRQAVVQALRRSGAVIGRSLPVGILVDGEVLARGGLAGVTVSRGTWRTLAVVHTPRDTAARTDASGATAAGRAVADALRDVLS